MVNQSCSIVGKR